MQGYTQRTVPWGLLLTAMLTSASSLLSAGEGPRLELLTRDSYLPGIPLLLRIELRSPDGSLHRERWNAVARLRLEGQDAGISVDEVLLRNGIGSALATIEGTGELRLSASLDGLESARTLADLSDEPRQEVSGELPEDLTEWSGVIHVTDNLTLPAGGTLRILPGALVLIDGVEDGTNGTDFNVRGKLESLGTRDRPVTFTAS
ncbi:MAG: hypothetical protein VYB34_16830, partial [Planctomycetota bacterium]|nr:hypothetical protein [Planctomycetota bacterium]